MKKTKFTLSIVMGIMLTATFACKKEIIPNPNKGGGE